jgi:hypothetical protein
MNWQPIKNLPLDGSRVLFWSKGFFWAGVATEEMVMRGTRWNYQFWQPTHWMVPDPPQG